MPRLMRRDSNVPRRLTARRVCASEVLAVPLCWPVPHRARVRARCRATAPRVRRPRARPGRPVPPTRLTHPTLCPASAYKPVPAEMPVRTSICDLARQSARRYSPGAGDRGTRTEQWRLTPEDPHLRSKIVAPTALRPGSRNRVASALQVPFHASCRKCLVRPRPTGWRLYNSARVRSPAARNMPPPAERPAAARRCHGHRSFPGASLKGATRHAHIISTDLERRAFVPRGIHDLRSGVLAPPAKPPPLADQGPPSQAAAAAGPQCRHEFTVTTTQDRATVCKLGNCSLREAVMAANACPGRNLIDVPAGRFQLTLGPDLEITEEVTIIGAGRDRRWSKTSQAGAPSRFSTVAESTISASFER